MFGSVGSVRGKVSTMFSIKKKKKAYIIIDGMEALRVSRHNVAT